MDQWKKPIPKDATGADRMENAILHLGRIIGALSRLQEDYFGSKKIPEIEEALAAAKRAATWLGVTLWEEEYS